jgi:hypothetical protein
LSVRGAAGYDSRFYLKKGKLSMIIVGLTGGLGNQMFQYAAGRALAVANNDKLKFDLSNYLNPPAGDVPRKYELYNFKVVAEEASDDEIRRFNPRGRVRRLLNKVKHGMGIPHPHIFSDPQLSYLPAFHDLSGDVYLKGFWQSPKYFANIEKMIRDELCPVFSGREETAGLLEKISNSNAVCINVRRADFLQNNFHGCMGTDYYDEALARITGLVGNCSKFVFSDDIAWCNEQFGNMPDTVVVGHEYAGRDFIDYLFLMLSCKHFIIPNSSFAWWAAWLCANADKQVIAPLHWFNDPSINTSDIVPDEWMRI